jgi:hypothetical protein
MHRHASTSKQMTAKELAGLIKVTERQAKSILSFVEQMGGTERASAAVKIFKSVTKKAA